MLVAASCLSGSDEYTPQQDTRAMQAITSAWADVGTGYALSLCEDVSAPDSDNDCQVEHVVRGGGRGRTEAANDGGIGCGGCPFAAVAYVTGTLSGPGVTGTVAVRGEITMSADELYAYPYYVSLTCEGAVACSASGTLAADGSLEVEITTGAGSSATLVVLSRTGAATCNP